MTEESTDGTASRRRLLRGAATVGLAALAGCGGTDRPETTSPGAGTTAGQRTTGPGTATTAGTGGTRIPYADAYRTAVDVVEAGADPDGGDPINPVLEELAGDDTLLYFPEGRYLMDDSWNIREFTDFAMVGDGATVVPEPGYTGYLLVIGWKGVTRNVRFENFTFDFRRPDTGARPLQVLADDGLLVRDVTVRGRQEVGQGMMRFDVTSPGGEGLVERLRLPDGAAADTWTAGCLVGSMSVGTLTLRDCEAVGFPNNGLYASPAPGRVRVEGGYFANNGIASVRLSGDSVVRGTHIRCDTASRPFDNMRGIRLRHGSNALIEDCTVEMLDATYSDGAITVEPLMESATVRDTTVRADADTVPAIRVKSPAELNPGGDGRGPPRIRCENVAISGSAADLEAVMVADRDDCLFRGLCVRQTGSNRDGVHLIRSRNSVVRDALIAVTGRPFVLEQSPLKRVNVVVESDGPEGLGTQSGGSPC